MAVVTPDVVMLDGATLTPEAVAVVARGGARVELARAARQRNALARRALDTMLERGEQIYGATSGVGALREHHVDAGEREEYSLRLLRSHACGAGAVLWVESVRAAMATRANQIGAGGAGVANELLAALVACLNAGLSPFTRELGSLGTGDLTSLSDIALALLGEGQVWRGDELVDAGEALAGIQDPYPFRALPQVDGAVEDALLALRETIEHELNFAGENALIVGDEPAALPNGNPHAAPLANAIDNFRTALAQSAALIAARVSALLDSTLTGLPSFLARRPGPESGALVVEYTAHAAAAEVRSLVTPVAAQTVSVSRGVESHSSLAPIAARRAHEALGALRVLVATELVVAVRALRLAGQQPAGAGTRALFAHATARLSEDLRDRPLHPDIEAARVLIEDWGYV